VFDPDRLPELKNLVRVRDGTSENFDETRKALAGHL